MPKLLYLPKTEYHAQRTLSIHGGGIAASYNDTFATACQYMFTLEHQSPEKGQTTILLGV